MPELTPPASARRFFSACGLDLRGQMIVVAVSGGPDSVCLLNVLHGLRAEFGFQLHVAHLDHRLRGTESDEDARYVASLAENLGVPVTVESREVQALSLIHI